MLVSDRSYLQKTGYFRSTPKESPENLEEMVIALRDGDLEMGKPIFDIHVRLVTAIARRWASRFPQREEDLSSEALLGLAQAIKWAGPHIDDDGEPQPSRLTHNNITGYIIETVRRFLRDFIDRDRNLRMPGRTFRHLAAKGRIDPEGNNDITCQAAFAKMRLILSDEPCQQGETGDDGGESLATRQIVLFHVPEARRDDPSPEFNDTLEHAIAGETHGRLIIDLRKQGHTYKEIADRAGISFVRVGQIVNRIERKFDALDA